VIVLFCSRKGIVAHTTIDKVLPSYLNVYHQSISLHFPHDPHDVETIADAKLLAALLRSDSSTMAFYTVCEPYGLVWVWRACAAPET